MNRRTLTVGLLLSLTVAAGLAFATGHLARTVPIRLDYNGVTLASCPQTEASALGMGGLRLICKAPLGFDLYIMYDSSTRQDGTINRLHFAQPTTPEWLPRELLGDDLKPAVDRLDCASAIALDRKTGEAPIPQNFFGAPLPGTYTIELASPCGRLGVEVGKPWS